jgi:hypothetical protein
MDLAPSAQVRWWAGGQGHDLVVEAITPDPQGRLAPKLDPATNAWSLGLEWEEPRDIRQVRVRFEGPAPLGLRVEYWRKNWPTTAPQRRPGARRGWIGADDPWHGVWTRALGESALDGDSWTLAFDPLDLVELGREAMDQLLDAEHYLARFRRTLKLRLVAAQAPPPIVALRAYSASTWEQGWVDVRWQNATLGDGATQASAYNGQVLSLGHIEGGVRLHLAYARCAEDRSDATLVTVHGPGRPFTFAVRDLDRGPIVIQGYGVHIAWQGQSAAAPSGVRSLYDRVPDEPEASLARALAEIPPLDVTKQAPYGRYLPLALDAGRFEFALRYNGELFADKVLLKPKGRDAARLLWPGRLIRFCFGSGDPPDFRPGAQDTRQRLMEDWLPVVISEWLDREIAYEQTAFVAPLDGPMTPPEARRGDESVVALLRFRLRNTTSGRRRARLWIAIAPQEELALRDGAIVALGRVAPADPVKREWRVAPYETALLRAIAHIGEYGALRTVPLALEPDASLAQPSAVLYEVDLEQGESRTISLTIPFETLTTPEGWERARAIPWEERLEDVVDYWRQAFAAGCELAIPDQLLADFHRAVSTHIAISADKDPESGLITVPAGTYAYGACGNEACWQITMLDQAGHHARAASYLETFLRTQGMKRPDGHFGSAEGALQGRDIEGLDASGRLILSETFAYNLDHGVIMECLADHYRYAGDRAWLERVTPNLIAAADFILRERQATQRFDSDGQQDIAWGLLPAGHLEDNPEWRHWFAVNAHAYSGLARVATVLEDSAPSEAARLKREAATYREDIRRAALRSMEQAPVVRLLDGTYVPHIPTYAGLRGRAWGWFREAAYGALHLLEGDVFAPDEPEMTWLLKDLEDNLFVSREWGRPVDMEHYWFSHGGVAIQANLMDLAIDYLRRGQIKHALRALYNNLGASLYPDVRCFTEHPVIELGHGVGPFYKPSDEAKALVWLRAMLVREEGAQLWLAAGAPRAWFAPGQSWEVRRAATFFGPLSYKVCCEQDRVEISIEPPVRQAPEVLRLWVRRPDHARMRSVLCNGQVLDTWSAEDECLSLPAPMGPVDIEVRYTPV